MRHSTSRLIALATAALLSAAPVAAENATAFYEENCSACHTIGGGPLGGPDLSGVTARRDREWLIKFLLDPEAVASDPVVARMIKDADGLTMPATEGMTREMAVSLLSFIEQRSRGANAAAPTPDVQITPADIVRGRALFTGTSILSASGPPCIACHDAGVDPPHGGRLGPDLTSAHTRLGGRAGLAAWLASTPTPLMRAIYRPAPLTADESRALVAYLEQSGAVRRPVTTAMLPLVALGLGGVAGVLLTVGIVWAGRLRAVRAPLVTRPSAAPTSRSRHALGMQPHTASRERQQHIESGGRP